MPDYTAKIDLPDHKRGDWWRGISAIGPVTIDGATPATALSRLRMTFKLRGNTFVIDSEAGGDAPAVIDNATTWLASVPPIQNFLTLPGHWEWDMESYAGSDTSPLTLYKGVLRVWQDVS